MKKLTLSAGNLDAKTIQQLKYAVFFVDETIRDMEVTDGNLVIEHDSDGDKIKEKVERLIERFTAHEFAFKENVIFENPCERPYSSNILQELKDKKIIKELETGVYTYREPFTTLLRFFDSRFVAKIGKAFGASEEYYPVIIHSDTLNKTNHFTSFPEHIQFVTHLKEDLDIIDKFADDMREHGGYSSDRGVDMNENFHQPNHTINPATCYHCYEGLQNETLEGDGKVVTAVSKAHRHESKNHRDFGRLLDFTMREIIFVGTPSFVKENRIKSLHMLMEVLREWQIDCFIENANDPFFTNDFKVKASFQRTQEMKYEVRMQVPYLKRTIAVASSNFHSNTFGKAFSITAGKRPAVTGCLAFGLERWVFAFLAQNGLDEANWPEAVRKEWQEWRERNG